MLAIVLEWLAFSGSLFNVWMYGRSAKWGPITGILVSLLFIIFGVVTTTYAAAVTNVVFLWLHFNNWKKANKMDWNKRKKEIAKGFQVVQDEAYNRSVEAGWWDAVKTEEDFYNVVPTKLCLIHSEISEAMEGHRKGLPDDKLPHYSMFAVELADAVIRIGDLAGKAGIDIGPIIAEKMEFNATRPDHKRENRQKGGGKKY